MEDDLQWKKNLQRKTTSIGRQPIVEDDLKISQQPLIGSYSDFKLQLIWTTISKSFKWRRPPIEDDLKILKVEYLNNLFLDHTQILNSSLNVQTIFCQSYKWRLPPMEEDIISQQPLIWSYSTFKIKLIWPNHILSILEMKTTSNGRRAQNIQSRISQQPLIGAYSNFKLKLIWPNHILSILEMKTTSNGRQSQNIQSRISQ